MAQNPQYTAIPRVEKVTISMANTNRDGTGSISVLISGATNGTLLDAVIIKATGTTTAGMIRLFHRRGAGTWSLFREYPISAVTPSGSVQTFSSENQIGIVIPGGDEIGVATHNAEPFNIIATGGDF